MAAQVHEFNVEMTCEGCSTAVQNVLGKKAEKKNTFQSTQIKGIDDIKIDLSEKKVFVTTALNSNEILETLKKTGKTCQFLQTH
ncbi:PREDICTED: copper transport protein ATOX1 isoform X1 [Atta cephalotes]|uniref:Copper transport protein ATOX1 n=1 Tax=Atta cephalotes TaxID=12957 RepID=A0A158NBZ4_ATTCE|nr:PREDICTED: copper transport protein ATOX1 isoform X1 [Atta cephalotes]